MNKTRRMADVKHRHRLKKREEKKKGQQPSPAVEIAKPAKKAPAVKG